MTCNNSTFSSNVSFIDGDNGGTRLLTLISNSSCYGGVTAGDVIHYDALNGVYVKSKADNPPNSEVFGIVESVNLDESKNVVIYGSINLPSSAIEDIPAGSTGAGGGSDIYFLSPDNEGKIRNTIPTELTHIVKPIYQVAPHGNGSYTGIVMNYIGYKVPSEITVFTPQNRSTPVGTVEYVLNGVGAPVINTENYVVTDGSETHRNNYDGKYNTFKNKYPKFAKRYVFKFEPISVTWYGTVFPMWDPTTISEGTQVYIHSMLDQEENPLSPTIIRSRKLFETSVMTLSQTPTYSYIVGSEYFLIKNPEYYGIGGIRITSIEEDDTLLTLPYIDETLKLFDKTDQDNIVISNNLDSSWITTLIKVKNSANVNSLRSLQTNELNTNNFNIDNQDLITLINNLETRILTAEQEINK